MTEDQFLDALAVREGTVYAGPPQIDQPTGPYGVTLPVLSTDTGHTCTVDDLKTLTVAAAREVARRELQRNAVAFGFNRIADEHLRIQLVDFGYNSGDARAIRWLQRAIGTPKALVTGALDPRTMTALAALPALLVNNALVAARLRMIHDTAALAKYDDGLETRALSFGVFFDQ